MNISQAPFNSSLMGVVRGVADYFSIDISTPFLYGQSGHAFIVNIHDAICPSGPYCWNINPFISLLGNCGIRMKKHGFFSGESSLVERSTLEESLKAELNNDHPCSMLNMDHQLITGYDDSGFICSQPWECDFPPGHLSFGSWKEIQNEVHACFFSFEKTKIPEPLSAVKKSLLFAIDLNRYPSDYTQKPYTCGIGAYDIWKKGIEIGYGTEQGNNWNGKVWSECRKQGALYFGEIAESYPACSPVSERLQVLYDAMGDALLKVSNRVEEPAKQIDLLMKTKLLEEKALELIFELAETIQP